MDSSINRYFLLLMDITDLSFIHRKIKLNFSHLCLKMFCSYINYMYFTITWNIILIVLIIITIYKIRYKRPPGRLNGDAFG